MQLQTLGLGLSLVVSLAVPTTAQTTWIVDASGRPGAQFAQIQDAIDAASAGDLVIVRDGFYRSFTLSKGLAIAGDAIAGRTVVDVTPGTVIHDVPTGQQVTLHNLFLGNLEVRQCDGVVAGSIINLIPPSTLLGPNDEFALEVRDARDVRMRQFGINPGAGSGRGGVRVANSRFEVDGCSIDGARGQGTGVGGTGLACDSGSVVVVSFGLVRGGAAPWSGVLAGPAITVAAGAALRVNGTIEAQVIGGFGGSCGVPAPAIVLAAGADARISSQVRVTGGSVGCGPNAPAYGGAGSPDIATPADPAMYVTGENPFIGAVPGLEIQGEPGALGALLVGVDSATVPLGAFRANPLRLVPLVALPIGAFPASGALAPSLPLPAPGVAPGALILLQTATLRGPGQLFLSNATMFVGGA
ncbi:MAG: hypothetical protein AAF628_22845 [Planctomycetota bacterium]